MRVGAVPSGAVGGTPARDVALRRGRADTSPGGPTTERTADPDDTTARAVRDADTPGAGDTSLVLVGVRRVGVLDRQG